ncbi:MAG: glycosyltransferase family 4 protein, partial [Flavobacteriales bacterium]
PKFARKADRIVTVSESSRNDIINTYGISPEKIDVAYNGVNEDLHPLRPDECEKVRELYTEGKPYFIFVGALHPRKNLARLFHAYDLFCDRNKNSHKLVIVGEKYLWNSEINSAFSRMNHSESVVFTGYLPIEQLGNVLAAAQALVFVSVFEGFGLPIIEAMRCEVPVITSSVSCMPEIAGGAALLCDPFSVEAIAEALEQMANNSGFREQLIAKGKENSKRFSWNHTAEGLWNSIEKTLHAKK